ncbi:MAG: MMPL family transporter [Candidatus Competibacteraceae bacterium]|nr:MMPL family transporter [Candidatus Competibacteraceae bacterium]MBK8963586.1 MMPL family transporter [Candidatus Competibacteraceae bacterium]
MNLVRRKWVPLLWLLAVLACGWIVATTPVVADLTLFAPRADPVAELLLEQLRSGPTTRLILLGLEGGSEADRAAVSRRLAERLRPASAFARVANGAETLPDAELQALFGWRYLLSPTVAPERFTAEGLRAGLQQRLAELQSPLAVFQKRWLPGDPTGELLSVLRLLQGGLREPAKRLGVWFAPDGARALLLVESRASGYDLAAQRAIVNTIRQAFAAASAGTAVRLLLSGPGVLATLSEDRVRASAEWLSGLSLAAVILLLLLVYGSVRTVWLGALPMLSALLAGAAAVDMLFGKMYLITLAFSITLLGETLDYPTYLFSHRRAGDTVDGTLRQLWPTLRLCVATTALGCLAMLDSSFPGLSQLGVYTIAGVVAAVVTARWVLPALVPLDWKPPRPAAVGDWADSLLRPRPRLALALGGCGALVLLGLIVKAPPLWENDLAALSPVPRELLRLDQELRTALGAPEVGHLIAVTAPDAETALRASETVGAYLARRQAEGALAGYDGAMRYLPSLHTQQQRRAALPEAEALAANLKAGLAGSPFKPDLFAPFLDAVAAARTASPLRPDEVKETLLGVRVRSLLVAGERGWTALLPLSGVRSAAEVAIGLPSLPEGRAYYLDLRAETNRLVTEFREAALLRLLYGSALIVAVVWLGLRRCRHVAAALAPVLLALVFTVALLLALGERLSLFHLVSLLLVVGVGVDYGLFFSRPATDMDLRRRTLHALLVCCGSALTVFAMLATSALPALRAIGLTVSLGVAASFIAALIVARPLLNRMS